MWYQVELNTVVPVMIALLPSWYHERYGLSFGEKFYFDPDYRTQTTVQAKRFAYKHFGDIGISCAEPILCPDTVDFEAASIPAILGCDVEFLQDNYPWAHHLTESEIDSLQLPDDIESVYPVCKWLDQNRHISDKYGQKPPLAWNTQGIQNIALALVGDELFLDYNINPERARRLLDISTSAIERSFDLFRKAGEKDEFLFHANCTVIMIGPETYKEWILPYELRLWEYGTQNGYRYFLHHCGIIDKYLQVYREIPKIEMIEIGWGSDIAMTQEVFPEAMVQYIVDTSFVRDSKPEDIRMKMKEIIASAANIERLKISIPDLDSNVPDINIKTAVNCIKKN